MPFFLRFNSFNQFRCLCSKHARKFFSSSASELFLFFNYLKGGRQHQVLTIVPILVTAYLSNSASVISCKIFGLRLVGFYMGRVDVL